jgi:hypothetical protein
LVEGRNDLYGRDDLGAGLTICFPDAVAGYKDYKVLSQLPIGTEVRIEHLYFLDTYETSTFLVATGSLTAGPYKNRPLELNGMLFAKDLMSTIKLEQKDGVVLNQDWTVNADVLEK